MTKPKTQTAARAMAAKSKALTPKKAKPAPQTAAARMEVVSLSTLHNDPHNVNKHTERGQKLVEQSIRKRGIARPGFAARNSAGEIVMLGGNLSSLEVPAGIGLSEAIIVESDGTRPIIHLRTDLDADSDEARLLALEDNVSGVASYDPDITELAELTELEGFDDIISEKEYRRILADAVLEGGAGDEPPEPQIDRAAALAKTWKTDLGQVWACGPHRVMCGDPTDPLAVARLMDHAKPDAVVTDPPYGIDLDTDYSTMPAPDHIKRDKGIKGGRKWSAIKGDAAPFNPAPLFILWDAPEMFLFGADYYADLLPARNDGSWLVWDKRLEESADLMYGSGFELCWSRRKHKRDLMRVKWALVFGTEKEDTKARVHPSHKPVLLFRWIYERFTKAGQVIADPYLGGGSSVIACEQTGRVCRAMEIDPGYVAVTLQRYQDTTGTQPVMIHGGN